MNSKYETELVPIPKDQRKSEIVISGCCCVIGGLLLFAVAANHVTANDHDLFIWWSVALLGLGSVFLIRAITRKHERQLTAAGKAAMAADVAAQNARSRKRDAAFMSWVFWIGVIAVAIYCIDPVADAWQGRIRAYPVRCADWSYGKPPCEGIERRSTSPTTFTVKVDQQIVVSLTEDALEPKRLFNCVVADRRNWTCNMDPEKGSLRAIMRNGDFSFDPPDNPYLNDLRFTSRLNWWFIKVTEPQKVNK